MRKRKVTVMLLDDAKEEYMKLNKMVKEERNKGITSSPHQTLLKGINDKIELLKLNCEAGIQIRKKQIPHRYTEKYEITNLWKINLPNYWRMIYTLKQPLREATEIEILTIWLDVLDILDHDKYNKIFGYKKK